MQYLSLSNKSLSYFTTKAPLSELGGSSRYEVFDNLIDIKRIRKPNKIENTTATADYLNSILSADLSDGVLDNIEKSYYYQLLKCNGIKFTSELENDRLERLEKLYKAKVLWGSEIPIKSALITEGFIQSNSRYQHTKRPKTTEYRINKSKVRQKMFSLFNLKCSRKFIAFYSVSFPAKATDDMCMECWDYWLSCLRKNFDLLNYIWVAERQKNGTLHFHMLTNNYMPILQVNRAMAIIINNQVLNDKCSWGSSSLDRYNGVDVDSIYNSKRHKKSGKTMNGSQVRQWLSLYITKYVTKNSEKFKHLCWHCSRSVSQLFTTTLLPLEQSILITGFLPTLRKLYIHLVSGFNNTWIFCFEPPPNIYEKIFTYNDLIFGEYVPNRYKPKSIIKFNTKKL
jgi:hypothetical protein